MNTLALLVEYDGTRYGGWQRQPNSPSIQGEIEKALKKITGFSLHAIGAGRTDAGVHARGQVASVPLEQDLKISDNKLPDALNFYLPTDIRIKEVKTLDMHFDARKDAIAREYSYTIYSGRSVFQGRFESQIKYGLNIELIKETATIFLGEHEFTAFSKNNPSTKSYFCNVDLSEWDILPSGLLCYRVRSNRFVYGMVRSLVGAMIEAGRGKISINDIKTLLESRSRENHVPLAPPQGLVFERVYYRERIFDSEETSP
jgi:tRNA pseudouridine38-40 synthase